MPDDDGPVSEQEREHPLQLLQRHFAAGRLLDEHLPRLLRTVGDVSADRALWQSRPRREVAARGRETA